MGTLELKIRIIDQIIHLSDNSLVMKINSLLSFHNSESEIEPNPTQLANIKDSEAQIAAGQFKDMAKHCHQTTRRACLIGASSS